MARSNDIQHDIDRLQVQLNDENHALQNLDPQIRHLQDQANDHRRRVNDLISQIKNRQRDLKSAMDFEEKQEAALQARGLAA